MKKRHRRKQNNRTEQRSYSALLLTAEKKYPDVTINQEKWAQMFLSA